MKNCIKCGGVCTNNAEICEHCGAKISDKAKAPKHSSQEKGAIDVTGKSVNQIVNKLLNNRITIAFFGLGLLVVSIIITLFLHPPVIVIVLLLGAISCGYWPGASRKSVKRLIATDSLCCINDVLNGLVDIDPVSKIAFADTFFYNKKLGVIVRYKDIVWVYKKVTNHSTNFIPTGTTEDIVVCLANGQEYSVNTKTQNKKEVGKTDVNGNSLDKVLTSNICAHNPNVLLGHSPKNQQAYIKIKNKAANKAEGK